MEYLAKCGESNIFNLGNGVGFTVKEIIETARKVLGWKPQYTDLETIISTAFLFSAISYIYLLPDLC